MKTIVKQDVLDYSHLCLVSGVVQFHDSLAVCNVRTLMLFAPVAEY